RIGLKQSIKKAQLLNCTIRRNIEIGEVLALAQEQSKKFSAATKEDYDRFQALYNQLFTRQKAATYGIYTPSGQLVASCVLFFSHKRIYYILAGNHPKGRTMGASQLLINSFIKDNAGQDILLDFEGSDVRSLAFFYSSFGSTAELYVGIKLNKLPKIIQLFKE
ncbi:MAG: GNAT family N-acetyltransferase, partial [Ferruginibacter sp.]